MGLGKGAACLLVPAAAIAVVAWLLQHDNPTHTGRRAAIGDHGGSPTARARTHKEASSSRSSSGRTIGGENQATASAERAEQRNVVIFCSIDGVPGLPKNFELDGTPLLDRADDPVAGVIRGQYAVPKTYAKFGMLAPGLVGGHAQATLDEAPVLIELRRPVEVTLRIEAPEVFALRVNLQRFHPHGWMDSDASTDFGHEDDTDGLTVRTFTAGMGRYRVVLPGTIVLKEFEVRRGSGPMTIPVDLRRAGWMKFNIVLPHPVQLPRDPHAVGLPDRRVPQGPHSIRIEGPGVAMPAVVPNTRRFVHPGDRRLRFTLSGARLAPHPVRGSSTLRGGGTAHLEAVGKPAAITFDWPGDVNRGLRAYRLPPDGPPESVDVRLYYEVYRFFGMQAAHDYVIWSRGLAPVVLRGVEVEGSICELGMLEPASGQTLRIRPQKLAESDFVAVHAHWLDSPIWLGGGTMFRAEPVAELRGLPAGTIRLRFAARGKTWTHDHVSNGKGVLDLPIELPSR